MCLVASLYPTLCDPKDCSPPGSSVHEDSPGKNAGVGCHASSRGSSRPRDRTLFLHTHTYIHIYTYRLPWWPQTVKNLPVGDLGSIPWLGRSPGEENGYSLQYSGLENSMDCIVHGVSKSGTQLNNFQFSIFMSIPISNSSHLLSLLGNHKFVFYICDYVSTLPIHLCYFSRFHI